jgi:hypothetical protein
VIRFLEANWLMLTLLAALAVFFLLFRNRTTKASRREEILKQGEPVVVEVLSNG